jgi:murein DD-endopeptidase MepM/ murein hydrolase activator NlpD
MTLPGKRSRSRTWLWLAAFAAIAVGTAGCGPDSTRFNESLFTNPFAAPSPTAATDVTGSVAPPPAHPAGHVDVRPLPPPPTGAALPQPPSASFRPAPPPSAAAAAVSRPGGAGWEWDGGTPIIVASGETIDTLARKYGVPASAIMTANGIANPASVRPGHRLVIPRYATASAATAPLQTGSVVRAAAAGKGGGMHVVAPRETLHSIARLYGKPVSAIATANKISTQTRLKIGDKLVIPGVRVASSPAAPAQPAPPAAASRPATPAPVAAPKIAQATPPQAPPKIPPAEPTGKARIHAAVPDTAGTSGASPTAEVTGSAPTFRWPVRGRVIAGFGPKASGQQNDGINLAVPEGTPIKAAEDGVVAYAGNELKGYGNLVLVRHANGFVTAYAHASELMVKRGDAIRRGQVIGKSGQTGNVTSPQLHFEIRKGAAPVDPVPLLDRGGG